MYVKSAVSGEAGMPTTCLRNLPFPGLTQDQEAKLKERGAERAKNFSCELSPHKMVSGGTFSPHFKDVPGPIDILYHMIHI